MDGTPAPTGHQRGRVTLRARVRDPSAQNYRSTVPSALGLKHVLKGCFFRRKPELKKTEFARNALRRMLNFYCEGASSIPTRTKFPGSPGTLSEGG